MRWEKATSDDGSDASKLVAGASLDLYSKLVLAGGHNWKKLCEIRRWNGARSAGKIDQGRCLPGSTKRGREFRQERILGRILLFVTATENSTDGLAGDPVSGSFVADGETPTSGAGRNSLPIAAISARAGSGDDDYARAVVECGVERGLHVADDMDCLRENLCQNTTYQRSDFGAPRTRRSGAGGRDLGWNDSSGGAGLTNPVLQRLTGLLLAHAEHIAGTCNSCSQKADLIPHCTRRFRSTAIDTEIIGHGLVLTQREGREFAVGERSRAGA